MISTGVSLRRAGAAHRRFPSSAVSIRRAAGAACEPLEHRTLLSTINWTNRVVGDNFAIYGGNTGTARAIVDRAIADWERVISDFNYTGGGNTFSVTINALDLGGSNRGGTNTVTRNDAIQKKPITANINMDDNGGGGGWYFDAVVGTSNVPDDGEYTTITSPFEAQNAVASNDFYRTIVHELGHAMGLGDSNGFLRIGDFLSNGGVDPNNGAETLRLLDWNGGGTDYTMTTDGGGHLFEGGGAYAGPTHPNDLLNDGRTVPIGSNIRQLISDTDASLLRDVYGYTVALPRTINTFYANLNTTTNVVTITGDANPDGSNADVIDLEVDGTAMSFEVNGTDEVIEGAQFTTIVVNAGADSDDVDVDELLGGKSLTVNGGGGNDNISAAQELQDIDTDIDSNFTVNGDAGTDTLVFNDQSDGLAGDDYTFTNTTFTKNASVINRVITYGTIETLTVNGSAQPSTYDINSLSSVLTGGLTINAGAADDTITVGGTVGDIDSSVNADVQVNGNGGIDTLNFNDSTDDASVDDGYTLTSIGFDKTTTTEIFGFATVEHVTLTAGLADNVIDVWSMSAATSPSLMSLVVNGNDGNDEINMGVGDLDNNFAFVAVTVNGQAGTDSLYLDDRNDNSGNDGYTITSTTFDKSSPGINPPWVYGTFESLTLDASNFDNAIDVIGTINGPVRVNGRGGADTIDVIGNFVGTFVIVDGGSGLDDVLVNTGGVGVAAVQFVNTQDLASLTIANAGTARVNLGGNKLLETDSLSIGATGRLDMTDNDMIVDYVGATQLGTVQAWINSARAGGLWNGFGITSSAADSNALGNTTLGAMEATDYNGFYGAGALFNGVDPDNSAVLVKYTYYGDANFSGTVNFDDYVRIDIGFNTGLSGWSNGDFNGSGAVNFDDYVLIDIAFNTQGSPLSRGPGGAGTGLATISTRGPRLK